MEKRVKFLICAAGIFVTYFYFGIIQEKLTRGKYGNEKFDCILSLVLVQCIVNYFYAKITASLFTNQGEDTTRTIYYVSASLCYLLAMVFSNWALKWISYPTQVIGKSAKPIPVMILGVLIARKSYPLKKYLFVLLVVIGVALFMYKDSKATSKGGKATDSTSFGIGEVLILASLTMDGVIGAIQDRMRRESSTKSSHMMINMNWWSIIYLTVLVVFTGEFITFFTFVGKHPEVLWELTSFSVASAIGQYFIFLTVSDFGPLPCSIITTTRKFFTVLASIIIFGNPLSSRQWLATGLVFTGLLLDSFFGHARKPTEKT